VRLLQLLEQIGTDTAEDQVPPMGAEQFGVVGEDDESGRAERGAPTKSEHHDGQLGSGWVRQSRLQRSRASEKQASIDVEERDLTAAKRGWGRGFEEASILAALEPDHRQIHCFLIDLEQQREPHADADGGRHRQEQRRDECRDERDLRRQPSADDGVDPCVRRRRH
jgi:hypothetical protein